MRRIDERADLRIEAVGYTDEVARRMVAAALADLSDRYGGSGDETPVRPEDFDPPGGAFLVAWRAGQPVGCAGWRSHGAGVAELKRLYTVPTARNTGVARRLLAAIEDDARGAGRRRIILETGSRQPEAIALYNACGYAPIPHFGHYADEPDVVSLGRDL